MQREEWTRFSRPLIIISVSSDHSATSKLEMLSMMRNTTDFKGRFLRSFSRSVRRSLVSGLSIFASSIPSTNSAWC